MGTKQIDQLGANILGKRIIVVQKDDTEEAMGVFSGYTKYSRGPIVIHFEHAPSLTVHTTDYKVYVHTDAIGR